MTFTPRQQAIVNYIIERTVDPGYPPTYREIGDAVGIASASAVRYQLERLQDMGALRFDPKTPRSLRLTMLPEGPRTGTQSVAETVDRLMEHLEAGK